MLQKETRRREEDDEPYQFLTPPQDKARAYVLTLNHKADQCTDIRGEIKDLGQGIGAYNIQSHAFKNTQKEGGVLCCSKSGVC